MPEQSPDPGTNLPAVASPAATPEGWRALASSAAAEFRERLDLARYLRLSDREKERLARRLREAIDAALEVPPDVPARITTEVERMRLRAGAGADPVALAWRRVRERARRTAAVGAVTTIPAMLPGFGSALAAFGLVADWRYVAEQQRDLVLEIATLMGVTPEDPTAEVRGLFLAGAGAAFGGKAAGEVTLKLLTRQVARRSMARLVPGAGAAVAGALNYLATLAIGRAAIRRFAYQAGIEVHGLVPARVHPALPQLQQAVVAAIRTAELGDGDSPVFSDEQRATLGALSPAERESLLDLAVVSAVAQGGVNEEEERVLEEIALALGVATADLQAARDAAEKDLVSYRRRFRRLLGSARERGSGAAGRVWQRTRSLVRRKREDGAEE
ncbi:hypothetical protein BH24GEM3_BH24GEM3_25670 [soil metagenome]